MLRSQCIESGLIVSELLDYLDYVCLFLQWLSSDLEPLVDRARLAAPTGHASAPFKFISQVLKEVLKGAWC